MKTRRLIVWTIAFAATVLIWSLFFRHRGEQQTSTPLNTPTPQLDIASTTPLPSTQGTTYPSTTQAARPTTAMATSGYQVRPSTIAPQIVTLGELSEDPKKTRFAQAVSISTRSAGLEVVALNGYREEQGKPERFIFQTPTKTGSFPEIAGVALATRRLVLNGESISLDNVTWDVLRRDPLETSSGAFEQVLLSLDIDRAGVPVARLIKSFRVYTVPVTEKGGTAGEAVDASGLEMRVAYDIQNVSGEKLDASIVFNSVNVPPLASERNYNAWVMGGFDKGEGEIEVVQTYVTSLTAKPVDIAKHHEQSVVWVGAMTDFFAAIVHPEQIGGAAPPKLIASAFAIPLNHESKNWDRVGQVAITTTQQTVAPGTSASIPFRIYLGPRKRDYLRNDYYSRAFYGYNRFLVIKQGPCSYCIFENLVDGLFWILNAFHLVVRDWGLSIIGLVCLVRLLLHPITKRSQLSMLRMGKFGPELEKLKKKYEGDKDGLNRAMMGFYKEHGATPVLGCLPMLLQTPIWIALWQSLQSTFDLRHSPFLYGFTWIDDLSAPDHLIDFKWFGWDPVHVFNIITIDGFNLLPLMLAVVFYVQTRFQPKPAVQTPEQAQQQKMMKWMTIFLFPCFLYSSPSGLCLYIMTSTLIGIFESKRVRDHYEQQEAMNAQLRLVEGFEQKPRKEPGRLGKWVSNVQQRVENMQRDFEKKQNKPKR